MASPVAVESLPAARPAMGAGLGCSMFTSWFDAELQEKKGDNIWHNTVHLHIPLNIPWGGVVVRKYICGHELQTHLLIP